MGTIMGIIKVLLKLLHKVFVFCGLYPLIIVVMLAVGVNESSPLQMGIWYIGFWLSVAFALLVTLQSIIRFKEPGFSWVELIKNRITGKTEGYAADIDGVGPDDIHGMVFGRDKKNYIIKDEMEDGHALVIGGAGSGKTSTIAIDTLMTWRARVFAVDLKPELHEACRKVRGDENILVFDPTDPGSCGYDPLYLLKNSDNPVQAAASIAAILCPITPDVKDPYWLENAQAILTAALLQYSDMSFYEVIKKVRLTPPEELIKEIMNGNNDLAKMHVSDLSGADSKALSSFSSTLKGKITIFASDTQLISCLDGSRARILTPQDLQNYDIFVKIPEHNLKIWQPLLTLIVNQFLESFEMRQNDINQEPVLFMLDEFPRLGKLPAIQDGLATLRSKKVEIMLFVQSKSQIDMIYGADVCKAIVDNCTWKAVLRATEPETQRWLSDMVGTADRAKKSHNYNQSDIGIHTGSGASVTTEEKRIIKPEEFAYLGDELILLSPYGYSRLAKVPYYSDPAFARYRG